MRLDVLGPLRVAAGPQGRDPVVLGAPRQRAVLAALALHVGHNVSTARIVDLVWGGRPPSGVATTLQAYVSGLRGALEPGRGPRAAASVLTTVPGGYRLALDAVDVDAHRFTEAVLGVRRELAPRSAFLALPGQGSPTAPEVHDLLGRLEGALSLWRGEAYAELGDAAEVVPERGRLAELRLVALEDEAVLGLWAGRDAEVAAVLEPLVAASPWRERLAGLRALALARDGRQADALAVLDGLRRALDDELGLEPGAELRDLRTAVLRQDPRLRWVARDPPASRPTAAPAAPAGQGHAGSSAPLAPRRWPLVGRDRELGMLLEALDAAGNGDGRFVGLVGEPGIGKTRLAAELIVAARERGATVLSSRCSQDEGAPPLWPWTAVLRALGQPLPDPGPGGSDFALWEAVVETVVRAAARPALLVLDDLHWADPATLRVLRLLVEHPDPGRLLVLLTWRPDPEPTGALADLVEALARRHAVRLALGGLVADDAAVVVDAVAGVRPDRREADLLVRRTDGNPFFLLEYAALLADRGPDMVGLAPFLAEADPPRAVQDVLRRRLDRLPGPTAWLLRQAAVAGREVELDVLAAALGREPDDVLDDLEPASRAGLLREDGPDRFVFTHALVRDTAYLSLPASRRARTHALLAAVLEGRTGREGERARHWAAAGERHVGRAWRAAVEAAAAAARLHDREQAAQLLSSALELLARDPEGTDEDRYAVLLELVEAYRWSGRWPLVVATTHEAVDLARRLGDARRLARAATGTTQGTVWQSSVYGSVDAVVVTALRDSLRELPPQDDPLRARAMLALAVETYYASTPREREVLVDEALAMTRRLGDDAALLEAYLVAGAAQWRPATAQRRLVWAEAAVELAGALGLEQVGVVAATLVASTLTELGRLEDAGRAVEDAAAQAERLHLPYARIVLDELVVGLRAMAGRFDEAEATLARIERLHERIGVQQTSDAVAGSRAVVRQWQGRWDEVARAVGRIDASPLPATAFAVSLLLQVGRRREAETLLTQEPIVLDADDWLSVHTWCHAAEVASALGDRTLAARVYARLAPYAGRLCMAGSIATGGPVDAYLALAAASAGEVAEATRHADAAERLLERWGLVLAAERFRRQRVELGL